MNRRAIALASGVLLASAPAGCGDGGGGGSPADAHVSECTMYIAAVDPPAPQVGQSITVAGAIDGAPGFQVYEWMVMTGGMAVAGATVEGPQGATFIFSAETPGVYQITLGGRSSGIDCLGAGTSLTVTANGANTERYLLRVIPGPGHQAAATQREITVYGGGSAYVGVLDLDGDSVLAGSVVAPGEVGQPGYVRARSVLGPVTEGLTDPDGGFELRVETGAYDLLIVPSGLAAPGAPQEFRTVAVPSAAQSYVVDAGETIAGTIRDGAGVALAGARVSLRADGVPTTVGTTDAGGTFEVRGRFAGAQTLAVAVSPPESSGLPTLEVAAHPALAAETGDLDIRYAATLATRQVAVELRAADAATPAPEGTRITWMARPIGVAGSVTRATVSAPAGGTLRRTGVAHPDGTTDPVALTDAVYDVVVEPPDGPGTALHAVDLQAGNPAPPSLSLVAPATVAGAVTRVSEGGGESPVAGARVDATPTGPLATVVSAIRSATTLADGSFQLALVPGVDHELVITGRDPGDAPGVIGVTTPGSGQLRDLGSMSLPAAVAVTGDVTVTRAGLGPVPASGVTVVLLCATCSGAQASRPVAEAVTRSDGGFTLGVPDPGVQTEPDGM